MRVVSGDVHAHRIALSDVGREDVAALAIQHDDPSCSDETSEKVILAPLVVVEATDDTAAREGNVCLDRPRSEDALAAHLE
jgi:hypothetical protein